jgi:hypothetical protein
MSTKFDMIDIEAANRAMSRIENGDIVTATFNGKRVSYAVIEKRIGYYGLYCQSPVNKVSMGLGCTDIYKEELAKMRAAIPVSEPKPRGRPPGSTLKPVTDLSHTAPVVGTQPGRTAAPYEQINQFVGDKPSEVPVEKAEDNQDWIVDSINTAVENFRDELLVIMQSIEIQGAEREVDVAPRPKTCGDCMHVELDGSPTCMRYKANPPLGIVLEAQKRCPGFEEIPF